MKRGKCVWSWGRCSARGLNGSCQVVETGGGGGQKKKNDFNLGTNLHLNGNMFIHRREFISLATND